MLTPTPATWIVRGATFALWALAAGSAAFWGLKVSGSPRSLAVAPPPVRQVALADPVSIAKLLGSSPAAVGAAAPVASLASRFQLLGVAAGTRSGEGAAVIAVDGKPPRSYRVGSPLDETYALKSVHGREAVIATQRDGAPVATLEVPPAKLAESRPAPLPGVAAAPGMPGIAGVPPQPPAVAAPPPSAAPPTGVEVAPAVAPVMPIMPSAPANPQGRHRSRGSNEEPT